MTAPELSRLGLGCYPLGGGYGRLTDAQIRETIDAAIEHGWTFFDTAEAYLDSEERLGELLGPRREDIFLATKVFPFERYSAANLRAALEGSLRRLRTDHVDLYQLHGPENWVAEFPATPPEEIAAGLGRLRDEGKLRFVGVCNFTVEAMGALDEAVGLFSTQDVYNAFDAGSAEDQPNLPSVLRKLDYVREHGTRFVAYSPLARGLLSDGQDRRRRFAPDDERRFLPRYQPGVYEHFVDVADRLSAWARERGHTVRELSIAWCLHNPLVASVLIGAKSAAQVAQVAGGASWHLTPEEAAEVNAVVDDLPPAARDALVTVWDHFSGDAIERLRRRRYAMPNPTTKESDRV